MNSRYRRIAERLRQLISEGEEVAALERESSVGRYIHDAVALNAWLARVENIVVSIFGKGSAHYRQLSEVFKRHPQHSYEIRRLVGVLTGALDDLENGFLTGQEQLIASAVFDSVLEQAKHLTETGYKDPAAVLARVVVEDALRRLSTEEGLDSSAKATRMNDALRACGRYPKPQWRLVQAWLDIGNSAAHGDFENYSQEEVQRLIEDVGRFLAQQLGTG